MPRLFPNRAAVRKVPGHTETTLRFAAVLADFLALAVALSPVFFGARIGVCGFFDTNVPRAPDRATCLEGLRNQIFMSLKVARA